MTGRPRTTRSRRSRPRKKRLNVRGKALEAKTKARPYGGAAMFIGDGTTNQSEELRPERLAGGGLRYLPVLTCQRLSAGELETDVASPWYGTPKVYTLQTGTGAQVIVHPSRLVRFIGAPLPNTETVVSTSWGDSILEAVSRALKDTNAPSVPCCAHWRPRCAPTCFPPAAEAEIARQRAAMTQDALGEFVFEGLKQMAVRLGVIAEGMVGRILRLESERHTKK
ncbi:anti-CBASS Acb1 family protein [Aurantimonas sp. A2-1-M11]|uniref:anti-CBASS protein Acb1 family protein n=1 Tax=Aurantimonas sp. A2-1-M11 TaxID=3113712 RepID=UPI002F9464B8